MKKTVLTVLCLFAVLTLSAAKTQVILLANGKDASITASAQNKSVELYSKILKDKKTKTRTSSFVYFFATNKSDKTLKKIDFKFDAGKCDLTLHIGHPKTDKLMWYSIKINDKEYIKDTKKGELIGIRKIPIEKVTEKKTFTFSASFRAPTRNDLKAVKNKAGKKSK